MPPEIIAAIDIQLEDNTPAPLAPIFLPHNPEINVLNKGIKKLIYTFSLIYTYCGIMSYL